MKTCNACLLEKPFTSFAKEKDTKDGYRNQCKPCREVYRKAHRAKNREVWNTYMREYRKEHAGSKQWKEKSKNRSMKFRYGITLDQYRQIIKDQDGKCLICFVGLKEGRQTHIDHCHKTKKFRGILCYFCNHYLAHISENSDVALNLFNYIKKHQS